MGINDMMQYFVPALVLIMVALIGWLSAQLIGKSKHERELAERMEKVEQLLGAKLEESRDMSDEQARKSREELSGNLRGMSESVTRTMNEMARSQIGQMDAFSKQMEEMARSESERMDDMRKSVDERMTAYESRMEKLGNLLDKGLEKNDERMEQMRSALDTRLEDMEKTNTERLNSIGRTVDDALGRQLGENFRQVSEQLEKVYEGLGEMQELANGVNDLKHVLKDVRARGVMGETRLEELLKQNLAEDKYVIPYAPDPDGAAATAAILMPGQDGDLYLPVDAGFSLGLYSELLAALDSGDIQAQERIGNALEDAALQHAGKLVEKIMDTGRSTEIAIMFVPNEGAYAELMKRASLMDRLQNDYRVMLTGPTTMTALLNSLNMGFRSIAIERRSEEMWDLLGSVKNEFIDFTEALSKTQKRIRQASEALEDATRRSKTLQKKLKKTELPAAKRKQGSDDDGAYGMGDWD